MDEQVLSCPICGCGLLGSIENVWIDIGIYTCLVTRDSPDCNWRRCKGCKGILCKNCYAGQHTFCCEEDRIVWRERAQAVFDLASRSEHN